jgi:hypothetical protein
MCQGTIREADYPESCQVPKVASLLVEALSRFQDDLEKVEYRRVKSALYLAVGQAMIATFEGTAFHVSYALASVVGIIIGAVMLRINIFSRAAAYALMVGDVIGLSLYIPAIGIFLSVISVPVLWICYVLIAGRLIQLGSGVSEEEASCIRVEGGSSCGG